MSNVTATIVVNFSDSSASGSGGLLTAELDTRQDGYNAGKSSFAPGDEPVILVRKSDNVVITSVQTSLGACAYFASGVTQEEEFLNFVNSNSANASKPITNNFVSQWYGANLGGVKIAGNQEVKLLAAPPIVGVGVLGITYDSAFLAYRLTGVPSMVNGKGTFNVLIAFNGTAS